MSYSLVFGFSTSRDYARAVRLASALPSYRSAGADREIRHSVPVDGAAPAALEELLTLVGAWRSSVLLADEIPIGRPTALRAVVACQRSGARSGLGELHCWGLPAVVRGRVPCRLVERALPWMLDGEYADSALLPRMLTAHARQLLVDGCPAYDDAAVLRAALAARGSPRRPGYDESPAVTVVLELGNDDELRQPLEDVDADGY